MDDIKVTVFTTTYNRGDKINNLYRSLLCQTVDCFEWLIVNDGSTDNTDELVNCWIKENNLNISYIKLEKNGGIANAMNHGIKAARGKLFFKIDSDDIVTSDAIEKVIFFEKTIQNKVGFAGVSGCKFYPNKECIGGEWKHKKDYIDATNFERDKYHLCGDKAEAYYTEVLKQNGEFPCFNGENYAFEDILWNRIAEKGLKVRWFKDKICQCEYLPDGESNHYFENCRKNFQAYSYWINNYKGYKEIPFKKRFLAVSKYFAVKNTISKEKKLNLIIWNNWWITFAYINGYCIYLLRLLLKPNKYRKKNLN